MIKFLYHYKNQGLTMYKFTRILMLFMLLIMANAAEAVTGSQGPTGPAGAKGATGPKGDKGLQGAVGSVGKTGATGAKGATGPKGDKGPAGASQGLQGEQGLAGPLGPKGDAGPRGPAGSAQAGNTVGDMQYWDGSQWQLIPLPSPLPAAPLTATLSLCNGLPTWAANCVPVSNGTVYSIGATGPAGGIVFYLTDNTGLHGLEAAPVDQPNAPWGCNGASIPVTTGTPAGNGAVGTGAANTAAIVAGCVEAGTAAKVAEAYTLNGFTDWYLPSKDELNFLYAQKSVVGGFANDYYWSSSENYSLSAWSLGFSNGFQYSHYPKDYALPVRAVRAF